MQHHSLAAIRRQVAGRASAPRWGRFLPLLAAALGLAVGASPRPAAPAGVPAPTVVDSHLAVRTVVEGLVTPISMAFLGPNGNLFVVSLDRGAIYEIFRIVRGR